MPSQSKLLGDLISAAGAVSVSGSNLVANTVANSAFQTGSVENYFNAQGLPIGRNRIINGDMVIDQRNAGASVSSANGFITDRWSLSKYDPTGGSYSGQQVSDAPTGFKNSLKVTVTSSITQSADQYWQAFQIIEGYNIADLGFGTSSPSQITVSFWVKSSVTGTYSIAFYNEGVGGVTRAYVTTYVINTANTWEQKSVTITGDGASGAGYWGSTNNAGLGLYFDLGCGTNQQATANTWASGNVRRVSGTVRLMNTSSATWQITGVQLEIGSTATPFERRLYNQELANCQRYCFAQTANAASYSFGVSSSNSNLPMGLVSFPVQMRIPPSVTLSAANTFSFASGAPTSVFLDSSGVTFGAIFGTGGTGGTAGFSGRFMSASSGAQLIWSSEL